MTKTPNQCPFWSGHFVSNLTILYSIWLTVLEYVYACLLDDITTHWYLTRLGNNKSCYAVFMSSWKKRKRLSIYLWYKPVAWGYLSPSCPIIFLFALPVLHCSFFYREQTNIFSFLKQFQSHGHFSSPVNNISGAGLLLLQTVHTLGRIPRCTGV